MRDKHLIFILILTLWFVLQLGFLRSSAVFAEEWKFVPGKVEEEKTFGDYKVVIEWDKEEIAQRLKIFRKNLLLYIKDGHRFWIGPSLDEDDRVQKFPLGTDITGDGQPDMVISEWSGGMHCCSTKYIFSIGDKFEIFGRIDTGHSAGEFRDLDKDGMFELLVNDWTFAYWNTAFAGSPAPLVVLKFKNGRYEPDMALMRKPAPGKWENWVSIKKVQKDRLLGRKWMESRKEDKELFDPQNFAWFNDDVFLPPSAWGHILDLIYSGNADHAKPFLAKVWPVGKGGQEVFWTEFMGKLADSPYCYAVRNYYGNRFPIVCSKQTEDFGSAGFGEILKRKNFQEMINKDSDKAKPDGASKKEGAGCVTDSGDCS